SSWRARPAACISCSMSVTSCPRPARSAVRCRPIFPAPATTTLMSRSSLRDRLEKDVQPAHGVGGDHDMGHVPLLEGAGTHRYEARAAPIHADDLDRPLFLQGRD